MLRFVGQKNKPISCLPTTVKWKSVWIFALYIVAMIMEEQRNLLTGKCYPHMQQVS